MTTLPAIERALFQRSIWGRGYRSLPLESKRRSAILWLRGCSKHGWLRDRAYGCGKPLTCIIDSVLSRH